MYKLSDKEATSIIVNSSQPVAWVALSSTSKTEITEALVTRAYAAVSCKNPLLRGVYEPEKARYSLVISDVSEIIQRASFLYTSPGRPTPATRPGPSTCALSRMTTGCARQCGR